MKSILEFKVKDYQVATLDKLKDNYKTMRNLVTRGYNIIVDNSQAKSFNTNIDSPVFFCFAINEAEAVGQMMLSDWQHKYLKISKIKSTGIKI